MMTVAEEAAAEEGWRASLEWAKEQSVEIEIDEDGRGFDVVSFDWLVNEELEN